MLEICTYRLNQWCGLWIFINPWPYDYCIYVLQMYNKRVPIDGHPRIIKRK